jgi:hypothetical protein
MQITDLNGETDDEGKEGRGGGMRGDEGGMREG